MAELIYDLQNIGVCYRKAAALPFRSNRFWALRDVSFQVYKGQIVGIIGRNGAGKSTLLKILSDIISPDCGVIWKSKFTVLMQSLGAGFDQRLTGRQNIYLSGLLLGMNKQQIVQQEQNIIDLTDIGEFIDEPLKCYSSGMRSRLGFSISYYADADVILIDEALAAGDEAFQARASELIKAKIKSDRTVVMVTHSMQLVKEMCDRVIQIENGHSLPELPIEQTVDRYLSMHRRN